MSSLLRCDAPPNSDELATSSNAPAVHSRGGFILGGRDERGNQLAQSYADASGYRRGGAAGGGTGSLLGYRATGSMNVWMGSQGFAAILIELASADNPEVARNLAGVKAVLSILGTG